VQILKSRKFELIPSLAPRKTSTTNRQRKRLSLLAAGLIETACMLVLAPSAH